MMARLRLPHYTIGGMATGAPETLRGLRFHRVHDLKKSSERFLLVIWDSV